MTHFVLGFLSIMTGEEPTVSGALDIGSVPLDLQAPLARQREQWTESKLKRLKKDAHWLDEAMAEGLLAAALWESRNMGWNDRLVRHVKLRSLLTDLKLNEA